MAIPAVGDNQVIPLEFHSILNPEVWSDLNDAIREGTENAAYYNSLYKASPFILTAISVSALAIAFFYAPTLLVITAGGTLLSSQIIFTTAIHTLVESIQKNSILAENAQEFRSREELLVAQVRNWDDVREKYHSFHISDERAWRIFSQIDPATAHRFVLRALAIEEIMRLSTHNLQARARNEQAEITRLQAAFQRDQFLLPPVEVHHKKGELEEKHAELFRTQSILVEHKIRAAFLLCVLSRPDELREVENFGIVKKPSLQEACDEERIAGISPAFVCIQNREVDVVSRNWILDSSIEQIAQRLFEVENVA